MQHRRSQMEPVYLKLIESSLTSSLLKQLISFWRYQLGSNIKNLCPFFFLVILYFKLWLSSSHFGSVKGAAFARELPCYSERPRQRSNQSPVMSVVNRRMIVFVFAVWRDAAAGTIVMLVVLRNWQWWAGTGPRLRSHFHSNPLGTGLLGNLTLWRTQTAEAELEFLLSGNVSVRLLPCGYLSYMHLMTKILTYTWCPTSMVNSGTCWTDGT